MPDTKDDLIRHTQRPESERLRAFVREGGTVVVHSMARLARDPADLRRIAKGLTKRGCAFAEFERALQSHRMPACAFCSPAATSRFSTICSAFNDFLRPRQGLAQPGERNALARLADHARLL